MLPGLCANSSRLVWNQSLISLALISFRYGLNSICLTTNLEITLAAILALSEHLTFTLVIEPRWLIHLWRSRSSSGLLTFEFDECFWFLLKNFTEPGLFCISALPGVFTAQPRRPRDTSDCPGNTSQRLRTYTGVRSESGWVFLESDWLLVPTGLGRFCGRESAKRVYVNFALAASRKYLFCLIPAVLSVES